MTHLFETKGVGCLAFLIVAFAASLPASAQTQSKTGTATGDAGNAAAGRSSENGNSQSGMPSSKNSDPTLQTSPYGSVPGAPRVEENHPIAATPIEGGGDSSGCQCYRIENSPVVVDGQLTWTSQRVASGRAPQCCPR